MDAAIIRQALEEKYLEPTRRERPLYAGIEVEMPILNLNKEAVDFDIVHRTAERFIEICGFVPEKWDDEGEVILASDPVTGDSLSFDCSYNNLELSLGKVQDLHLAKIRFFHYYDVLQELFAAHNYTLTGMGVNPYRIYNNNVPIPNGRYRMLFHHLHSYPQYSSLPMHFHNHPAFGTFSSASQVQLDVMDRDLITIFRAFSRLEPVKALLFSNSVLLGENDQMICARDMFWENSTHGINPHNVGMYECDFYSEDELLDYISSTSMYCVERDDKYLNFAPTPLLTYLELPEIEGEYYNPESGDYETWAIKPELEDLQYLRTFKYEDLTFRGTVEFRSCCTQPIRDTFCVAVFHLGLLEKLHELDELLEKDQVLYHHGYTASELRHLFVRSQYPPYISHDGLYRFVGEILDLAKTGLTARGMGEEKFLDPLYDRWRRKSNPATDMLRMLEEGRNIEDVIMLYR